MFKTLSFAFLATTIILYTIGARATLFNEVKPMVYWKTDYVLAKGTNQYDIIALFTNPCEELLTGTHNHMEVSENDVWKYQKLVSACNETFNITVKTPMRRLAATFQDEFKNGPTGPRLDRESVELQKRNTSNEEIDERNEEWFRLLDEFRDRPQDLPVVPTDTMDLYKKRKRRYKRELSWKQASEMGELAINIASSFNVVTNLISSVYEIISPDSTSNRMRALGRSQKQFYGIYQIQEAYTRNALESLEVRNADLT